MRCVSAVTERELREASRAFLRDAARIEKSRARLRDAIIGHKRDGAKVSDIEDIAPYRRGRITAILDEVGLVEKKPKASADEAEPASVPA